jgi:cell fate regulator YaaT (PSP1 superfamily)
MTEIIGVRFKTGGKMYYFNPNGVHVDVGEHVVIETSKGIEFGQCAQSNTMVDEMELVATLRPMLRVATPEDFRTIEQNEKREKEAFVICQRKIAEHNLDMKLVEVKYSFDGSKVLFFFTSDGRVDFRGLVKDLAAIFRTRIELRQIGVRDETKMMGGLGICGRPYCCSQFLADFQPVSIKMAKTQNISLNPTKISGACGRLMCCLKYEQDAYEDLLKRAPKADSLVKTPDGVGTISAVQLLSESVRVILDSDPTTQHTYRNSEIEVIRSGKGKRPAGYELPEEKGAAQPKQTRAAAPKTQPAQKSTFNPEGKAAYSTAKGEAKPAPQEGQAEPKTKAGQGGTQSRRQSRPAQTGEEATQTQQRRKRPAPAPKQEEPASARQGEQAAGEGNQQTRRRRPRHHRRSSGAQGDAPQQGSGSAPTGGEG